MRFPNRLSIECCRPCVAPRQETSPVLAHLGPTAALTRHPPPPGLSNSCCCSSTVEAELLPVDTSRRRAFEPGDHLNRERSARLKNPIHHSKAWEPLPCPR